MEKPSRHTHSRVPRPPHPHHHHHHRHRHSHRTPQSAQPLCRFSGSGSSSLRNATGSVELRHQQSTASYARHNYLHHHRHQTSYPMIYMDQDNKTEEVDDEVTDDSDVWMERPIDSNDRVVLDSWVAAAPQQQQVKQQQQQQSSTIQHHPDTISPNNEAGAGLDIPRKHLYLWLCLASVFCGQLRLSVIIPTLSTDSIWEEWPYLEQDPVHYNLVFALQAFGRLGGTLSGGILVDLIGRRALLLVGSGFSALLGTLSSAATTFPFYAICRMLSVLFAGPMPPTATVYGIEFTTDATRHVPAVLNQVTGALMVCFAIAVKMVAEAITDGDSSSGKVGGGVDGSMTGKWRFYNLLMQIPTFLVALVCVSKKVFPETPEASPSKLLTSVNSNPEPRLGSLAAMSAGTANMSPPFLLFAQQHSKSGGADRSPGSTSGNQKFKERMKDLKVEVFNQPLGIFALALTWVCQSFTNWGIQSYSTVLLSLWGLQPNWILLAWYGLQAVATLALTFFLRHDRVVTFRYGSLTVAITCTLFAVGLVVDKLADSTNWHLTLQVINGILCVIVGSLGGSLWACVYSITGETFPPASRGFATHCGSGLSAGATVLTTYVGSIVIRAGNNKTYVLPFIWAALYMLNFILTFFFPHPYNGGSKEEP